MSGPGLLHVNVRCADLERTRQFYERFTGMKVGDRPPFSSRGYWLYAGAVPVVHLVERRPAEPEVHGSGAIDHVAFEGRDLDGLRRTLAESGIAYRESTVPGGGTVQVFFRDPNGIQLEIAFPQEPVPAK